MSRVFLGLVFAVLFGGASSVSAQVDLRELQSRVESGDAEAMNSLGNAYASGNGVAADAELAMQYFRMAVAAGHAQASFNLGLLFELGRGVPSDLDQAFQHYLTAAQRGFPPAQFNVGNMYSRGIGVAADPFESVLWFRQAAAAGIPDAQFNLGLAYETGRGVSVDPIQAVRWYTEAIDSGFVRAAYNLALMYEEGRGVDQDEPEAARLYATAAEQNYGPAQNNLAIMHAEGRGGFPQSLVEAYPWFVLASENGMDSRGRELVLSRLNPEEEAAANLKLVSLRHSLGRENADLGTEPAAVADDNAALRQAFEGRIVELEFQIERLRRENTGLVSANQALARDKAELTQRAIQVSGNSTPAMGSGPEVARLNNQLSQLLGELGAEPAAETVRTAQSTISRLAEENRNLNSEVKRATLELSGLGRRLRLAEQRLPVGSSPADGDAVVDPAEFTRMQATVAQLERDLDTARQERARALDESEALTVQRDELARRLESVAQSPDPSAELEARLRESELAMATLQESQMTALGELTTTRDELDSVRSALSEATARAEQHEAERDAALSTLGSLRTELDTTSARLAEAQSAAGSAERVAAEITQRDEVIRELRTEVEEAVADRERRGDAIARATAAEANLASSAFELAELRSALEIAQTASAQATATREENRMLIATLRGELQLARDSLESARAETSGDDEALRSEMARRETELAQLREELGNAQAAELTMADTLEGQIATNQQLSRQIESQQSRIEELDAGGSASAAATAERIAFLEVAIQNAEALADSRSTDLQTARDRANELEQALENSRLQQDSSGEQLAAVEVENRQLSAEAAELRQTLVDYQNRTREDAASVATENQQLRDSIEQLQASMLERATVIEVLRSQVAQAESDLQTERASTGDRDAQLSALRETNEQLATRLANAEAQLLQTESNAETNALALAESQELLGVRTADLQSAREDLQSLERQLQRVSDDQARATGELVQLRSGLAQSSGDRDELAERLAESRALVSQRESELANLQESLLEEQQSWESRLAAQTATIEALQSQGTDAASALQEARERADQADEWSLQLEASLVRIGGLETDLAATTEALTEVRAEASRLTAELGARDELVLSLRGEIDQETVWAEELEAAALRLATSQDELDTASSRLRQVTSELAQVETTNLDLRNSLGGLEDELDRTRAAAGDAVQLEQERNLWREQAGTAQEELAVLRQTHAAMEAAFAQERLDFQLLGAAQLESLKIAETNLAELREQLASAAGNIDELTAAAGETEALRTQLVASQRVANEAGESVSRLQGELIALAEQHEQQIVELQNDRDSSATRASAIEQQLSAAREGIASLQAEALDSEALRNRLDSAEQQVLATEAGLSESREQVAAWQARAEAAETELGATQNRLATYEEEVASLRSAQAAAVTRAEELNTVQSRLAELTAELAQSEEAIEASALTNESLQAELATSRRQITELRETVQAQGELETQYNGLGEELSTVRARLAAMEVENEALQESLSAAETERGEQVDQLMRDIASMTGSIASLEDQLTAARAEAEAAQSDSAELEARLENAATHEIQLAATRESLDQAREVIEELQARATAADRLSQDLVRVEGEHAAALDRIGGLEASLSAVRSDYRTLLESQPDPAEQEDRLLALTAARDNAVTQAEQALGELEDNRALLLANSETIAELTGANDQLQLDLESSQKATAAALAAQAEAAAEAGNNHALELEITTLSEHVQQLEDRLGEERASTAKEFAALTLQLQRARETSQSLNEANRALLATRAVDENESLQRLADIEQEVADLVAERSELDAANLALQTALREAEAAPRPPADWQQQREALTSRLEELAGQLADAEAYQLTVAELTGVNEGLQTSQRNLEEQLGRALTEVQAANERNNVIAAELASAREERRNLETQLASTAELPAQLAAVREELASLRGGYDSLSRENTALARQLAESEAIAENQYAEATETWESDRSALLDQVAQLRQRETDLGLELEAERAQRLAALTAHEQSDSQLTSMQARLTALDRQVSQVAELQLRVESAEADLTTQRAANLQMQRSITADRQTHEAALATMRRENSALTARLRQAQNTLDQIAAAARVLNPGASGQTNLPGRTATTTPRLPAASAVSSNETRTHTVVEGDSLTRISMRYYGTAARWQDIYRANRDLLSTANALRPGQELRIP